MRNVTYRRLSFANKNAKESYTISLIVFVYDVVSISESGIVPPLPILNERFLSGGKCNPFGDVEWEPFEISCDEYDQLVDEIEAVDPASIWSHKGISFVKLRRAKELDHITDSRRWTNAVSQEFSDDYVAKLIELNPANSTVAEEDEDGGKVSSEKPDLDNIRRVLLELSVNAIRRFADEHKSERFYAFGFDLNAAYGDVLLCTNTEVAFEKTAQTYGKRSGYTVDDLAELKKNFGDWHYQGFNLDYEEWDERWRPISQSIDDYVFADEADEKEVDRFLSELIRTCSFVLLELKKSGVLGQLNQEPGFYIQCINHDENEDLARQRLEEYRHEYAALVEKSKSASE